MEKRSENNNMSEVLNRKRKYTKVRDIKLNCIIYKVEGKRKNSVVLAITNQSGDKRGIISEKTLSQKQMEKLGIEVEL